MLAEASTAVSAIDGKATEPSRGNAWIAAQPLRQIGRKVAERERSGSQRIVRERLRTVADKDKAGGHPPTQVLTRLYAEIAVERLDAAVKRGAIMPFIERFDAQGVKIGQDLREPLRCTAERQPAVVRWARED
jgi:hypothetical protein